jgi:hypothetical protein
MIADHPSSLGLSAYRNGRKVRKTENYKLAEALRDHARDLILLSAMQFKRLRHISTDRGLPSSRG